MAESLTLGQRIIRWFSPPPVQMRTEVAIADTRRQLFKDQIPYNPDDLIARKGIRIYDLMRRDDQVRAALTIKKYATLSTGWRIDPAGNGPDDQQAADCAHDILEGTEGALEDDLYQILSALDYGFSVTEMVFKIIETGPWAGKIGLKSLKTRAPHNIDFKTDEFGNLLAVQQDSKDLKPVEKFAIFSYNQEFSNWYGTSDLRAAYAPWWIKENAQRWLATYLERYAVPFPVAKVPLGLPASDKADLEKVLNNIQAATSMIIPGVVDLNFPEVPKEGAEQLGKAIEALNIAIARAILLPNLLGLAPQKQTGSYARAVKDFDLFMYVVDHLRLQLAENVITEQVIKPLTRWNWNTEIEPPKFRFNAFSHEQQTELLRLWLDAIKVQAVGSQPEDEAYIREITGFPEREEEEPEGELGPDRVVPPTTPKGPNGEVVLPKAEPTPQPGANPPASSMAQHDEFEDRADVLRDPATADELRAHFAQLDRGLRRIEEVAATSLSKTLLDQRDQLLEFVRRRFENGIDPVAVNRLQLRKTRDVQAAVREMLRTGFEYGRTTVADELHLTRRFAWGIPPREALRFFDDKMLVITGLLHDELLNDSKMILLNALKTGEPLNDTIIKLQDLYAPFVGTVAVAPVLMTAPRLATIIRTNLTEAFNEGRKIMMSDPEVRDEIAGVRYSAVLDARTTPVCRFLDGKVFRAGDPALDRLTPPNHFNCRSILVPILIEDEQTLDYITETEIGKGVDLAGKGFV